MNINSYGWESTEPRCSHKYIAPKILYILNRLSVKRIADIGCGNGVLCGLLKRCGYDVIGIEKDTQGFNIARKNYPDVNFYNLGLEDDCSHILREVGCLEAILSTEVVEHLYSPHQLPIFAKKLLKDGGLLIISTPYHGYIKNLVLSLFNRWDFHHTALWCGGHIKFFSRKTLIALLKENGFDTILFYGVGRLPFIWKSMILVSVKRPD